MTAPFEDPWPASGSLVRPLWPLVTFIAPTDLNSCIFSIGSIFTSKPKWDLRVKSYSFDSWRINSGAFARAKRAQRSATVRKFGNPDMHPRNFGSEKIVRTKISYVHRRKMQSAYSAKNDTWSISGHIIGSEAKTPAKCCWDERGDDSFFFCQWQRCNFLPL